MLSKNHWVITLLGIFESVGRKLQSTVSLERCEKRFQSFTNFQVFAKEVIEKVQELDQEKMKTEKAFHDFLPLTIVRDIKLKKVVIFI